MLDGSQCLLETSLEKRRLSYPIRRQPGDFIATLKRAGILNEQMGQKSLRSNG
jgi:hypothetical protein